MADVTAGLAVLAGIAGVDAISAVLRGEIHRGDDHRSASALLAGATVLQASYGVGAVHPGVGASGADIAHQLVALGLQLVDPVLDHVADADDADQPVVLDHRHVADPPVRHEAHEVVHRG